MPGITDSERSLDRVAKAARDAGATGFGGGPLFLMPSAQKVFFPFLEKERPALARQYREWYARSAYLGAAYKKTLGRPRLPRPRPLWIASPVRYSISLRSGSPEQAELFDESCGL